MAKDEYEVGICPGCGEEKPLWVEHKNPGIPMCEDCVPDDESGKKNTKSDNLRLAILGYHPEDAPSKSHKQLMALLKHISEETDIEMAGCLGVIDEERFDELRDPITPEFPPDMEDIDDC